MWYLFSGCRFCQQYEILDQCDSDLDFRAYHRPYEKGTLLSYIDAAIEFLQKDAGGPCGKCPYDRVDITGELCGLVHRSTRDQSADPTGLCRIFIMAELVVGVGIAQYLPHCHFPRTDAAKARKPSQQEACGCIEELFVPDCRVGVGYP